MVEAPPPAGPTRRRRSSATRPRRTARTTPARSPPAPGARTPAHTAPAAPLERPPLEGPTPAPSHTSVRGEGERPCYWMPASHEGSRGQRARSVRRRLHSPHTSRTWRTFSVTPKLNSSCPAPARAPAAHHRSDTVAQTDKRAQGKPTASPPRFSRRCGVKADRVAVLELLDGGLVADHEAHVVAHEAEGTEAKEAHQHHLWREVNSRTSSSIEIRRVSSRELGPWGCRLRPDALCRENAENGR